MKRLLIGMIILVISMTAAKATPRISFFEEFPEENITNEIKLINFNTSIYVAAQNVSEFLQYEKEFKTKNKHITKVVYWPILEKKEGYWISPFSDRKALERIFNELKGKKIPVMLDLELPTSKNPSLYITQLFNFRRNKELIKDFIKNYHGDIYAAEYYSDTKMLSWLGLHYDDPKIKVVKLFYHSMHRFSDDFLRRQFRLGKEKSSDNLLVGFGTIAPGIQGNEPILSPEQLEKDVRIAQEAGVKEVVIFRLGGLNEKYRVLLKKYAKN